ncbi:MAG: HEPN domain-containing protein [Lachnospiraceae bacterium]|nr:HEPN domain-containing protein [Lachnospiraceae bacterium]
MEERVIELSKYRFETAVESIEDARLMFNNGRYKNALNRAYYSIFHAIRAVNTLDGFDSSKHSGVIAFFNQTYVKEGIFPREMSRIIKQAYDNREKADYLDFYVASKDEAEKQILRAEVFAKAIKGYLSKQGVLDVEKLEDFFEGAEDPFYNESNMNRLRKNAIEMDISGGKIHEVPLGD